MKKMEPADILRQGLGRMGFVLGRREEGLFMGYLGEIKRWGRTHSLTSIRTDRDIVVKHFLDSCLYMLALDKAAGPVADVGSGAGLPGIPIAIMRPGAKMFLIESVGKKAAFLRHVLRELGLEGVSVIEGRVEDVRGLKVDAAVTRALFSVGEFVLRAGHIVSPGGVMVMSKGPGLDAELEGFVGRYEVIEADLPFSGAVRRLVKITPDEAG